MYKHPFPRYLPAALALALLPACGGGGGGGSSVSLTSGEQGEDPVVVEIPIAYVRRPVPMEPPDLRDPLAFNPGAQLLVREVASPSADEIDITGQIAEIAAAEGGVAPEAMAIDIKDLESSYDGKLLLFAARAVPEPVAANLENTTWNLWLYDFDSGRADYLIPSRILRNEGMEAGGGQDIAPYFLGDDRIVFSSSRQVAGQARLLNEGRSQIFAAQDEDGRGPAAVLHIYDPLRRNEEFTQISFNLSHDLDPVVLDDGHIVFSRWNNTATDHISLYRINPEGSQLTPLYGFDGQRSGTGGAAVEFSQPRELDDGRLLSLVRSFESPTLGGELTLIDTASFAGPGQSKWDNPGAAGTGQESLTDTEVRTDGLLSRGGQYGSAYPLRDGTGRLLLTWSECRVLDRGEIQPCSLQPDNEEAAPPLYGAWIYDPVEDTQRPLVKAREGFWISEIIAAEPRDYPDLAPGVSNITELAQRGQGQLRIGSVYDVDGVDAAPAGIRAHATPGTEAFMQRPARFLRILQPVPLPDEDVFEVPDQAWGVSRGFGFREIVGYVPVEPDGSVTVNLPASRPFTFSVLDERGRRSGPPHNYWLQLAPGETLRCSGCHEDGSDLPHGHLDSQPPTANPGARALASGNLGFTRTNENLFATERGESMAEVWDFHRPSGNPTSATRELALEPTYIDEWSGPGEEPQASIDDRSYDPAWIDIPTERAIVVPSFDPSLPGRIVINYVDHIQPIWQRTREIRGDADGNPVDNCVGCHSDLDGSRVAAGQLDLTDGPSDIEPDHYRSYRELLSGDNLQWLDATGAVADRTRLCTEVDDEGNALVSNNTLPLSAPARAGSANSSVRFFACFEGGNCGPPGAPALPDNCSEDDGEVVPVTRNTVDHVGLLSEAEKRLLSEWLDIGAQYYNNPFDSRLVEQ